MRRDFTVQGCAPETVLGQMSLFCGKSVIVSKHCGVEYPGIIKYFLRGKSVRLPGGGELVVLLFGKMFRKGNDFFIIMVIGQA